jgi:hypothetical protein
MNPGSLPPLSQKARALLLVERDISPQPELVRRRALLRARTALWHARGLSDVQPGRLSMWKRLRFLAVAALCATSALAAWLTIEPASLSDGPPIVVTSPTRNAVSKQSPQFTATPSEPNSQQQFSPQPTESELNAKRSTRQPSTAPRTRAVGTQKGTASEELALLDRARRAVVAGDFDIALRAIQRHARSYPKSQLGEEREALRVKALKGAGLAKRATEAARDFESRYPKSVLAPELNKSHRTTP